MAVVLSRASRWWNRAAIVAALALLVISMIPLYWIGSTAFKPRAAAATVPPTVFFTPEITPFIKLFTSRVQQRGERDEAVYAKAPWWEKLVIDAGDRFIKDDKGNIETSGYVARFVNSIVIAVSSTFFAVALGTMTAYGFSRFRMPGEGDWLFFILSTRMLPPVVVAIPMFLMYRAVGMTDTHIGLIILYTAFNLSFSVWLMKGFIDEIPKEYEEAALVDGASSLQILRRVFLPTMVPAVITVTLFAFVTSWNEFLGALVIMRNDSGLTLPLLLALTRTVTSLGSTDWGMLQAGVTVAVIPCVVVFFLLQRYYVAGLYSGAVK